MLVFWETWWQEIVNFLLLTIGIIVFFGGNFWLKRKYNLIGYFLVASFIIEICATYFTYQGVNNLWLYHLLNLIQFALISFQFYVILENPALKKALPFLILIISFLLILLSSLFQSFESYPSLPVIIKHIFFCILALYYFRELLNSQTYVKLLTHAHFWFVSGILIYSCCGIIVEGTMRYLIKANRELANQVFYLWLFLNYLLTVSIIITFVFEIKKRSVL